MQNPIFKEHEAVCEHCGWKRKFQQAISSGLQVGDILFAIVENPNFNRCGRCKRSRLRVTKVPEFGTTPKPKGFWKIPQT